MNAFSPDPTQSVREITNWVFVRSLLILLGAFYSIDFAGESLGPLSFVTQVAIGTAAMWFSYLVLFRGIEAYLSGKNNDFGTESAN